MKPHLQTTVRTLLEAGASQRQIEQVTGIDRKTIRGYQKRFASGAPANSSGVATDTAVVSAGSASQIPPPRPPASAPVATTVTASTCEPHRAFIEAQLRLRRNAMAIYQDLVDHHGFTGAYNAVKRFTGSCVRVDHSSYAARPAPIGSRVLMRVFECRIEIRDLQTQALLRTHARAERPGTVVLPADERVFNLIERTRVGTAKSGTRLRHRTQRALMHRPSSSGWPVAVSAGRAEDRPLHVLHQPGLECRPAASARIMLFMSAMPSSSAALFGWRWRKPSA